MAGKLSGSVNAQAHIGITVDASGAINAAKQLGVLGNALQSLMRGNKISDYWNSQLSSLDAVSNAYEHFMRELGKPMPSKSLAEELVKGFNAFLAQGGEAQALIERYGAEVSDVIAKARNLAPEIENAFNVNFLSEAFDVFNGLDEAMKRTGNDINAVFSQLSSGDTTKLRSEIDELRNSLENATDYINTLQGRIRDLNNMDAGQLQSELKSIRQRMENEFHEWANVNGLGEHYDWGTFQSKIDGIADGSLTARDAIAQVKFEWDDLLRDASVSGDALGSGVLEMTAKMEALEAAMADIQSRMAGGVMPVTGTGETVATGSIQEDVIRRVADAMIEFSAGASEAGQSADSAVEKITALVQSLTNFGSVDSGNLETMRNMFGLISQFNRLSVSNASMENLRNGIESLMAVANSAGADKINALRDLSRVDFKSFNELHVSKASLSNLAEFLPTIGTVNIEPLKQLASLRWDNLKEMKVSKASVENLANLAKIADTIEELRARIEAAGIPTTGPMTPEAGMAGAIEDEAAAHEHAAEAAHEHAAAEQEAAAAESEHASAAQMDAEAARDAAAAEQELNSAAATQTDISAQIEQGAAAHEHSAEAARQQAAAEMEVAQAEEQAAAGSGVIEEAAGAHEAATAAAQGHAEAEHAVSQATEEVATSGNGIEQAASAHERAAQAANELAAAEQATGNAAATSASAMESAASEEEASLSARAAFLKQILELQKQVETFKINQPEAYAQNSTSIDAMSAALKQTVSEGRADIDAMIDSMAQLGVVSAESLAQVKAAFAEITSNTAVDNAMSKQVDQMWRGYYGEIEAQEQKAIAAAEKYYQLQEAAAAKAAEASAKETARQIDAWKTADDTEAFRRISQEKAAWREYYADIEAQEQRAAASAEKYYQEQEAAAAKAAAASERETERQINGWERLDDARIASAQKRQAAEENLAYKEAQAAMDAENQKKRDLENYYAERERLAERAAVAERETIRRELAEMDADLARQQSSAEASTRLETEVISLRTKYTELMQLHSEVYQQHQADIDAYTAKMQNAGEVSRQEFLEMQRAYASYMEEVRTGPEAQAQRNDSATQLETQVINLRSQYAQLMQQHSEVYQQHQADIDAYMSKMQSAGDVTRSLYLEMQKAYASYSEEVKTGAEAQAQAAIRQANIEKQTATMREQVQKYMQSNTRVDKAYGQQLSNLYNELAAGNVSPERLSQIAAEFANIKAAATSAGISGQTFFEKLQAGWSKFAGWSLVSRSFMLVIRGFKQMVNSVKEIDLAMTELRKVTDLTAVGYENFYQQAVDATTRIGATISDTINATAD